MIYTIIDMALDFLSGIYSFSGDVIYFFTSPISDFLIEMSPGNINLIGTLLNTIGLGQYTVFQVLFGGGILVYCTYQFIVWLLNIVT